MLNKLKYINKFQELYKNKNNSPLSEEEALIYLEKLILLVKTINKNFISSNNKHEKR